MPKDDNLKLGTRDKLVQKMTRDGAEQQNLSKGNSKRISNRLAEGTLQKEREADTEFGGRGRESPEMPPKTKQRINVKGNPQKQGAGRLDDCKPQHHGKNRKTAIYKAEKGAGKGSVSSAADETASGGHAGYIASDAIHGKIYEETDDNVGVEAAHGTEQAAERLIHRVAEKPQKKRLKKKSVRDANVKEQKAASEKVHEQSIKSSEVSHKSKPASKRSSRLIHESADTKVSELKTDRKPKQSRRLVFDSRRNASKVTENSVSSAHYQKRYETKGRLRFDAEEKKAATVPEKATVKRLKRQGRYHGAEGRKLYDNTGSAYTSEAWKGADHRTEGGILTGGNAKASRNKAVQKSRLKREYASAYRNKSRGVKGYKPGGGASSAAMEAVSENAKGPVKTFFSEHKATILIALFFFLVLFIMITGAGTVGIMMMSGGESFAQSTYLSSDDAITSASDTYAAKEEALRNKIDKIPENYPGYDEYRYDLDDINYDPYVLTSYLTAVFKEYELSDVEAELQGLFEDQYTLTLTSITETRYDSDGNPYSWHVLQVTLTNNGLENVVTSRMDEDQRKAYDLYQENYGNRSYLFGVGGGGAGGAGGVPAGLDYAPTDEALLDERFRGMITEAENYLGYPYVWGGSNPSTSFDCSGFVCWVINHSGNGWNVGRTTANGLVGCTARVTDPKPGDLIFFQGTYDTVGASHVGIVVDPEKKIMIHCGNPIQYASYDTTYWRQHFMCYGRLP